MNQINWVNCFEELAQRLERDVLEVDYNWNGSRCDVAVEIQMSSRLFWRPIYISIASINSIITLHIRH